MWQVVRRQEVSYIVEIGPGVQERTNEFSYVLYQPLINRYCGQGHMQTPYRHNVPDPFP